MLCYSYGTDNKLSTVWMVVNRKIVDSKVYSVSQKFSPLWFIDFSETA